MASWSDIQRGIFAGESGGDYNALFNYQNRPSGIFSDVRVTDMSIADVLGFTDPRGEYGQYVASARPDPEMGVATPVGAYQVVGSTLRDAVKALNLDPNQKFDKATQDKVGQWIYQTQGTGAWQGYKGPQSKPKDMNMSMNPNAPQRTGLLGFMDIMRRPDEETGMTAMERFGAALDPLLAPNQRMGEQLRASGARRLQTQSKNKTIDTLTKRAGAGDRVAAMVLQGLQTGAYDAKTAMSLYMQEMMKGGVSKSDMNKMVVDARKEFTGLAPVKDFSDVSFAYSRVVRSADDPSPAGDLALIFNFMKVLDPGSVVREGEFATAQNSGGVDERVRSLYNQVREGTRLTETQRADFVDRAGRLYGGAQEQYQSIANQYTEFARQAGLDPQLVIPDFSFKGTVPEKPTILQVPPNPMPDRFLTDADWKNHWQNVMSEEERKEFLGG
jgi:hypothetical protein